MTTEEVGTTNLVTAAVFQSQQVAVEILRDVSADTMGIGRTEIVKRPPWRRACHYKAAVNVGKVISPYILLYQAFLGCPLTYFLPPALDLLP
jgi:hypothetical protein